MALGGDGGDELFAGYDPFKALQLAQCYSAWCPRSCMAGCARSRTCMPVSERNMSLDFKIKRALARPLLSGGRWNPVWLGALEPSELRELFDEPVRYEELFEEAIAAWEQLDRGQRRPTRRSSSTRGSTCRTTS